MAILGLNKEVLVTGTPVFGFDGAIKMVGDSAGTFLSSTAGAATPHPYEESRKAYEELAICAASRRATSSFPTAARPCSR